jgi:stage V sporulation protein B
MSMATTLFPAFSYNQQSNQAVAELFSRAIKYLLFIMAPLLVVGITFAEKALVAWLGDEFARISTLPSQILFIALFFNAFAHVPLTVIYGLGRPDIKAKIDIIGLPLFIILSFLLVPAFGIVGAALAKLCVSIYDSLLLFVMAKRVSKGLMRVLLTDGTYRGFLIASLLGVAFYVNSSLKNPFFLDTITATILIIIYGVIFFYYVIDKDDKAILVKMIPVKAKFMLK